LLPGQESADTGQQPTPGSVSRLDAQDDQITHLLSQSIAELAAQTERLRSAIGEPESLAQTVGRHAVLQAALDSYLAHRMSVVK
jgi:hypothetical protein